MTVPDRLVGIVLALQGRPWQRAADLADRFGVSTRTIYRDMRALGETGVPVVAVPGKGYRLPDDYVLPPLLFTTDEAVMLLLGARSVAGHFEGGLARAARSGAVKLAGVLPGALREEAERLEETVRFVPVNAFDRPGEEVRLRMLRRALVERRRVRFRHAAPGGEEAHTFDPYGVVEQGGAWYVVGYSHERERVDTFRLARMEALTVLDEPFLRPAAYQSTHPDAASPREVTVRVLFDARVAQWVQEAPPVFTATSEEVAEGLLVTLRVRREAEVLPWLLGWGGHVRVLDPPTLRARIAREAERIAAHYASDPAFFS